ncbi:MAG: hypothetical protein HZB55_06895 [Deltaproteobacteria bacterium]|nr:hypothetical protein [Deltaproteobacteria bacterium]
MNMSIRRYENLGAMDEIVRRLNVHIVPVLSNAPGFISYSIVDAGAGVAVAISAFETQAQADESTRKVGDLVRQHLAPLAPTPPQVTVGEVVLHKTKWARRWRADRMRSPSTPCCRRGSRGGRGRKARRG